MNEKRFTPGPWEYHSGVGPTFVIEAATAGQFARVSRWTQGNRAEAEANARLIAAAPDLYEALQAFIDAGDGHDDFTDEWPAARAALAKARGEKP